MPTEWSSWSTDVIGPSAGDYEIADVLRRARLPVIVVANKVDDPRRDGEVPSFMNSAWASRCPSRRLHGLGTGDLLDAIMALVPVPGRRTTATTLPPSGGEIPVAIVGRPNAGKSSLLNALVGEERVLVSEQPHTTRDSIDSTLAWRGRKFRFVDTAGMRKAAKVSGIEYYSYLRSLSSLDRAHVAVIVVDATVGLGELDLQIAAEATRAAAPPCWRSTSPICSSPTSRRSAASRGASCGRGRRSIAVSAVTTRGLDALLRVVAGLESRYTAHIPTPGSTGRWRRSPPNGRMPARDATLEDLLHRPVPDLATSVRDQLQRPQVGHARLRILHREPPARRLRP